jgi:transcriptional regulator GlxA family with amidase domain
MSERLLRVEDWETLARAACFQPTAMSALCAVSLRQMQRFFARHFNATPSSWSRQLRCRLARELVAEGWSNKAVAATLGFGNESHLCHEFKKFYGAPPQTFAPTFVSPATPSATSGSLSSPGSGNQTRRSASGRFLAGKQLELQIRK